MCILRSCHSVESHGAEMAIFFTVTNTRLGHVMKIKQKSFFTFSSLKGTQPSEAEAAQRAHVERFNLVVVGGATSLARARFISRPRVQNSNHYADFFFECDWPSKVFFKRIVSFIVKRHFIHSHSLSLTHTTHHLTHLHTHSYTHSLFHSHPHSLSCIHIWLSHTPTLTHSPFLSLSLTQILPIALSLSLSSFFCVFQLRHLKWLDLT